MPPIDHAVGTDARASPTPTFSIVTLGTFAVTKTGACGQREPLECPPRPLVVLEALVAAGGQKVDDRWLMAVLWPHLEDCHASANLGTNLHRLRKALGVRNAISTKERRTSLSRACFTTDCEALVALHEVVTQSHPDYCVDDAAHEALRLYRGAFLPDLPHAAQDIRADLHRRFRETVTALGSALATNGAHDDELRLYEGSLAVDPGAQGLHRRVIAWHVENANGLAAVEAYERYEDTLAPRGRMPDAAARVLYRRALASMGPARRPSSGAPTVARPRVERLRHRLSHAGRRPHPISTGRGEHSSLASHQG